MKILMLTPYLPYPLLSGGQIRTYNLLKQLAKKHQITLFALIKDEQERQFIKDIEPFCERIRVFKRSSKPFTIRNIFKTAFSSFPFLVMRNHVSEAVKAIKQELLSTDYDLIHAETFYMMPHIPKTEVPILLVEQTIEYLGYQSYAKKHPALIRKILSIDIRKIIRWEQFYWRQADLLVAMSENDKNYIQHFLKRPEKAHVVSNGVDCDWFAKKNRAHPVKPTVLYVGTFKWLPNIEAVEYLVEKIWPLLQRDLPGAQLKIVGNAPTKKIIKFGEIDQSIDVVGRVEDIRDAFCQCHVLLAPVFSGKGTRYKILEAMAAGTPIVATSTAVEGLNVIDGTHVLIGEHSEELASKTRLLLQDKDLWNKLSLNGKEFVKKHYDWTKISLHLDQVYQSVYR